MRRAFPPHNCTNYFADTCIGPALGACVRVAADSTVCVSGHPHDQCAGTIMQSYHNRLTLPFDQLEGEDLIGRFWDLGLRRH
jgi:hypothetical protein